MCVSLQCKSFRQMRLASLICVNLFCQMVIHKKEKENKSHKEVINCDKKKIGEEKQPIFISIFDQGYVYHSKLEVKIICGDRIVMFPFNGAWGA